MSTKPIDQERVAKLTSEGMSAPQIADILGCTTRSVVRARARLGIAQPKAPLYTAEELELAERMLADGASASEVSRTLGRASHGNGIRRHFPQYVWTRQQVSDFAATCSRASRLSILAGWGGSL